MSEVKAEELRVSKPFLPWTSLLALQNSERGHLHLYRSVSPFHYLLADGHFPLKLVGTGNLSRKQKFLESPTPLEAFSLEIQPYH